MTKKTGVRKNGTYVTIERKALIRMAVHIADAGENDDDDRNKTAHVNDGSYGFLMNGRY